MDFAPLGVRLLLSAVFAVAAIGKLADLAGFRRTLGDFGVAATAAGGLGVLLPGSELLTAVLLLPTATAWWGALSGLVLLAVFSLAVSVTLSRGRAPDCRCFGQVSATPIGASTLMRNLVLAAGAVFLLSTGPGAGLDAAFDRWRAASANERLIWLATAVLVAVALERSWRSQRLAEQTRQLRQRLDTLERQLAEAAATGSPASGGLPVKTPAPRFDLPRLEGDRASLDTLTAARLPVLLIFSSSHCPACGELWRDISQWQRDRAAALTIAVIGSGSAQVIETKLMGFEVSNVLLDGDTKLSDAYRVPGIPSAVVIAPDGTIDSETVMGPAAIRALVNRAGTRAPAGP